MHLITVSINEEVRKRTTKERKIAKKKTCVVKKGSGLTATSKPTALFILLMSSWHAGKSKVSSEYPSRTKPDVSKRYRLLGGPHPSKRYRILGGLHHKHHKSQKRCCSDSSTSNQARFRSPSEFEMHRYRPSPCCKTFECVSYIIQCVSNYYNPVIVGHGEVLQELSTAVAVAGRENFFTNEATCHLLLAHVLVASQLSPCGRYLVYASAFHGLKGLLVSKQTNTTRGCTFRNS